jgi:hypothetical protein
MPTAILIVADTEITPFSCVKLRHGRSVANADTLMEIGNVSCPASAVKRNVQIMTITLTGNHIARSRQIAKTWFGILDKQLLKFVE